MKLLVARFCRYSSKNNGIVVRRRTRPISFNANAPAAQREPVILIDTSVWIDHLHAPEPLLTELLAQDEAGCHPSVIEELALGSIKDRAAILNRPGNLHRFPVLSHTEVMTLIDRRRLWGRGLSLVDAHLFGSAMLVAGARLWTRDKRLAAVCHEAGLAYHESPV